jgi:hypothetical protein
MGGTGQNPQKRALALNSKNEIYIYIVTLNVTICINSLLESLFVCGGAVG